MSAVRLRAVPAVLLAALALPAGAQAAGERIPGPYHGGNVRDEAGPVLAYLKVAEDGDSFEAALTVRAECEAYGVPVQARIAVPDSALDEDGRATVVRRVEGEVTGPEGRPAREDGESTVTVEVGDDGRARGTVRLASTFYDAADGSEVARCDTGTVAFRARIVPVGLPRGREGRRYTPRRATELLGIAGVQPFVARVTAGGHVSGMAFVYRSGCQKRTDGRGTRRVIFIPEFRVRRDGSFRVRASQQLLVPGGSEEVRIDIKGRYGPAGTVRGSVRLRGSMTSASDDPDPAAPAEAEVAECDTGSLRLRAIPTSAVVRFDE